MGMGVEVCHDEWCLDGVTMLSYTHEFYLKIPPEIWVFYLKNDQKW